MHQIIANSTFSWWAALLNSVPERFVFYPSQWFTNRLIAKSYDDLIDLSVPMMERWKAIDVVRDIRANVKVVSPNGIYGMLTLYTHDDYHIAAEIFCAENGLQKDELDELRNKLEGFATADEGHTPPRIWNSTSV